MASIQAYPGQDDALLIRSIIRARIESCRLKWTVVRDIAVDYYNRIEVTGPGVNHFHIRLSTGCDNLSHSSSLLIEI